jgi:hypothetical protein
MLGVRGEAARGDIKSARCIGYVPSHWAQNRDLARGRGAPLPNFVAVRLAQLARIMREGWRM